MNTITDTKLQIPKSGFIHNLLGKAIISESFETFEISKGIDLHCTQVVLSPSENEPEEMAYLSFYPVDANEYYLQLSFLPEFDAQSPEGYNITQLIFNPSFFRQWPVQLLSGNQPFRFDRTSEQAFSLNAIGKDLLEKILKAAEVKTHFINALRKQEYAIGLLSLALEGFLVPDEANKLPACNFLNNSTERDKVLETQRIILQNLENPLTIKALSREVGMNECYLKKGFKAMFGKTIHEFQQLERIKRSKALLSEGIYSINEVAFMMGYGSPSHFSTSFKKITGMKPCELIR
ncbi:helix-turn-helix transcriptional regulator [Taibaiella lutea]|uniref:Helix-turn-helix transcriptional regulator n=1 Tax=Taibaiella lutea TaxID=2608001 RepID=A0A5M6CJ47_9BACT|nr:AraC family transcriptional regulator [Taibaiella lutea]KAA5534480.1 helix-turn-helix transcriptional regulator [Taibaiella lutea]